MQTQPLAQVSAGLPDLPRVPASVGPVICLDCRQRTATVSHIAQDDGTYAAVLSCPACGLSTGLWMEAYTTGLSAGLLIEAARRGDPRVELAASPGPAGGGSREHDA